ncbi:MAG: ATP-binding cassette domain-containing protein [Geminicoccaceae bacterium]
MTGRPTKLACRNVWKVFGLGAERLLREGPSPSPEALTERGLVPAVVACDLAITEGEIFVIMGLSGSGKSTLVRCLSRLVEPTIGESLFEDRDLLRMPMAELIELRRHTMGMVFQHFALLPHLSVLANVAFPLEIQGIARGQREARAREMIELVGLAGREDHFPRQLSGGQQQRVGIARSLAVGPELWFLDEPFSALDPLIRREMQNEFLRLQRLLHKTIVFITHDFDEAVRLADRIAIMQSGRVVQVGTAEELVLQPATDYVAAFTADAPRAKILSAGAVMRAPDPQESFAGEVEAAERIAAIAQKVEAASGPLAVIEAGCLVGAVDRDIVMGVLVGRRTA